jgi:hypothetical protein
MSHRMILIAWPAFLAACVLELLVFAVVDPLDLHWWGQALAWSRQSVYAAAFFVFWLVTACACALTMLLRTSPAEVNQCPFDLDQRPSGCPGESGVLPS